MDNCYQKEGTLPKYVFCAPIILEKLVPMKAGHYKHNCFSHHIPAESATGNVLQYKVLLKIAQIAKFLRTLYLKNINKRLVLFSKKNYFDNQKLIRFFPTMKQNIYLFDVKQVKVKKGFKA